MIVLTTCNSLFGAHWKRSLRTANGSGESMPRTKLGLVDECARSFLKACREALRLTQDGLSGLTDVSQQQISKYEAGKDRVSLGFLRQLEALWGVSFESFERSTTASGAPTGGFTTLPQTGYVAEASPEIARGSGGQQIEAMTLDLRPIEDPADRQRLRDLYAALLPKRGGV